MVHERNQQSSMNGRKKKLKEVISNYQSPNSYHRLQESSPLSNREEIYSAANTYSTTNPSPNMKSLTASVKNMSSFG